MEQKNMLTQKLVNHLIGQNIIQTERVRDIMLTLDRGDFWSRIDQNGNQLEFDPKSYEDSP